MALRKLSQIILSAALAHPDTDIDMTAGEGTLWEQVGQQRT